MRVNKKKPLTFKNRTKFFNPDKDKTHVTVSSSHSYQSRQIKIEGYETRLYWQYKYCQSVDGQTFFYTLTYNDKAMPEHYGMSCFDYEDLRDLLTGGFRKMLLRKYGTTFKYFIGAELGDGKGERGFHNNPHYHILFFLEPDKDKKFPYDKISPEDFRHLVRKYWQGFDQDTDGFHDFKDAKYGIACEGDNCGLVYDFGAISYVAKYVCKDVKLIMKEADIRKHLFTKSMKKLRDSFEFNELFFNDVVNELYNIPLDAQHSRWKFTKVELIRSLFPHSDAFDIFGNIDDSNFVKFVSVLCSKLDLWPKFNKYLKDTVESIVADGIREWRNRYCNKCRISQGVGDFALKHIKDLNNPTIPIDTKNGPKERPISLYYYRKLFTELFTPVEKTFLGKDIVYCPLRILSEKGIEYKVSKLDEKIDKLAFQTMEFTKLVLGDKSLFQKMVDSDVNTSVKFDFYTYSKKFDFLNDFDNALNLFKRYAIYKLVYENRYFKVPDLADSDNSDFPVIDYLSDYRKFLHPSVYSVHRSDIRLDLFIDDGHKDYLSFEEHPYFLLYIGLFRMFDLQSDYFFIQSDDKNQREAEKRAETKRFHDRMRLKEKFKEYD